METLTPETIQKTREWFVQHAVACLEEVSSGAVKVNDETAYSEWRTQEIIDARAGRYDHTFTFLQRAHFIQTGEMVALLP